MNLFALSGLITGITTLILALIVIKFGSIRNGIHRTLGLINISLTIWGFGCMMVGLSGNNAGNALFWWKIAHIGGLYSVVLFLHNSLLLTNVKKRMFLYFAYAQATLFQILSIRNLLDIKMVYVFNSFHYIIPRGITYPVFEILWIMVGAYGNIILYRAYHNSGGYKRIQLRYYLIAFAIGYIGGATHHVTAVFSANVFPYGAFLVPMLPLLMTYAILRHKLLDIEVIIKKTLAYSLLVATITILYFIIVYLMERFFSIVAGYQSIPLAITIIALFSIIFTPLKNKIQYSIDKYFFKGTIDQIEKEKHFLEAELQRSERLKTVSTLAAGMAHEIKNPLTSIKTFVEYVDQKHQDPDFRTKFKNIVPKEIDKITNIINQLLDYSKTDRANLKLCNIHHLLDYVLDLHSNQFIKRHIVIQKLYNSQSPDITCHENQIKQAFINIVLNSMEAMPKGGNLTIETQDIGKILQVIIQDTGQGIPKEKLQHLFDPFYTTKEKGTGLGLFIVHQIIENNKGKIVIDSKPNKGTTVKISFTKS